MFYKVSDKDLLAIRNRVFLDYALAPLLGKGFEKSPFYDGYFGRNNLKDYTYDLYRITDKMELEFISVYISKGDKYIKIYLNVFQLNDEIHQIKELEGGGGMKFVMPPNSLTRMRLRDEDYKGIPLFYLVFCPNHKIGSYFSKSGFDHEIQKIEKLLNRDMENIDSFIKRWHEMYTPAVTDREGNRLEDTIPENTLEELVKTEDTLTTISDHDDVDVKKEILVTKEGNVRKRSGNKTNDELFEIASLLFPDKEFDFQQFTEVLDVRDKLFVAKDKSLLSKYDYLDLKNLKTLDVLFILADKENLLYNLDWRGEENEREIEEFIESTLGSSVEWNYADQIRSAVDEDDQFDGKFILSLFKAIDKDLEVINKKLIFYEFNSDSYGFSVVDKNVFDQLVFKFKKNFHGTEKLK